MAALRQLGCQYLLFITFTTDISGDWPEVSSGVVNIARDGRRVYCMNDRVAIALRANTPSDRLKPRYYWKRTDQNAKECVVRVLRVPGR